MICGMIGRAHTGRFAADDTLIMLSDILEHAPGGYQLFQTAGLRSETTFGTSPRRTGTVDHKFQQTLAAFFHATGFDRENPSVAGSTDRLVRVLTCRGHRRVQRTDTAP